MTSFAAERLLVPFRYPGNKQEAIRLLSTFPDQSEIKNIKDSNSDYLIHHAARCGWTDIVELLITTYNCDANCTNFWGETSLYWACRYSNHLPTVKLLTNQYCLNPLQADKARYSSTPLDWSKGETRLYLQQIIGKCVFMFVLLYICT